jgi:hypothetical protein
MLEIICVPVIVALVFGLMELYKKYIAKGNEKLIRIIPIIACICGIIAGIICFFAFPSLIAATNLFTAILVGGASGLSATGCNQIFKQLTKYGIEVKEVDKNGKIK